MVTRHTVPSKPKSSTASCCRDMYGNVILSFQLGSPGPKLGFVLLDIAKLFKFVVQYVFLEHIFEHRHPPGNPEYPP